MFVVVAAVVPLLVVALGLTKLDPVHMPLLAPYPSSLSEQDNDS